MLRYLSGLIISFSCVFLCGVPIAQAQEASNRITLRGKTTSYTVPPSESIVEFYAISKGNDSIPFAASIVAPEGARVSVTASTLKGGVARALGSEKRFWTIPTANYGQGRRDSWVIRSSSSSRARSFQVRQDSCGGLSDAQLKLLIESLEQFLRRPVSQAEACGYVSGETNETPSSPSGIGGDTTTFPSTPAVFEPTGDQGVLRVSGILEKDACRSVKRSKYLLVFSIDLSQVERTEGEPLTIEIAAQQYRYRGRKSASIKPISDGKFAPKPLVLMQSTGYRPEQVELVKWRRNKPANYSNLPVENYLGYKGLYLARMVADGFLTGGRGTFQIKSPDNSAYGVCFELERKRQRVFGYPQ